MKKNKKIEDLKQNYNNIEIPDKLNDVVNDALNTNRNKKSRIAKWSTVAASICVIIGAVNLSPAFANTLENIPVIGNIIKVMNFKNYRVNKNGYDVSIDVPKIEGLKDKDLEYKLNKKFEAEGKKLYEDYLKDVKDLEELGVEGREYAKSWYEVINENDNVLSLVIYNYYAQGSSSTTRKFYNIDKKNQTVLTLEGMFKGSDYVNVISENIKSQMRERTKKDPNDVYWIDDEMDIFTKIKKDQGFYINDKNEIVICFDKYEVAPGASGLVEFTIPKEVTKQLMK
ncbi:anti-sigma-V factor rsiV [Terrisporobacter mayombei]|uniref:Anti-sigma-V factor RsiV n=1 Tax=Terrisporobacter mayombei TaxID=1541 RepID=A0ABY9Q335_9FIRM|nr:anti-sigma-V factor rsiV [Terrisporobacter mayombei]MCC3867714.1 anti-sigma-V factor rsiV [Terrisporobacter mayombei]WMT81976.1 Anti-sigma-V factor RsiV [Terrisporobacter mayombei]